MTVGVGYTDRSTDEGQMFDVDEIRCVRSILEILIYEISTFSLTDIAKLVSFVL